MLKIGDRVAMVHKVNQNNVEKWILTEEDIVKIVETKKGRRYYTKSKFHPFCWDDMDIATSIMEDKNIHIMITDNIFRLNEEKRCEIEHWIKYENSKL